MPKWPFSISDIDGAQRTAAEIGGSTIGLAADVAQAASVDRAFAQVADQLGGLDILVNNAGIVGTDTPVKDLAEDDWDRVLDINLKGTFLCSQAALRYMLPQQSGVICSLASISGKEGNANMAPLLRIQGGRHLLYQDAGQRGLGLAAIRVNCVAPALIDTPILQGMDQDRRRFLDRQNSPWPLGPPRRSSGDHSVSFIGRIDLCYGPVL